jgi:hypothetical protein
MYINGILDVTATSSVALDAGTTYPIYIGGTTTTFSINAYISDFRITENRVVYTSNFVPQNTPLQAIQNTTLLLNNTSGGVVDASMISNYETAGDAALSTSVVKYGSTSIFFNGSTAGLRSNPSPNFSFGSGNFTIEFWYYPTSTAGTNPNIMCNSVSGTFSSGMWSFHAPHSLYANKYSFWVASYATNAALLISSSNIATNTWTYVTITRSGNTWRMFINGTIEATQTHSGVLDNGGSITQFIGYQPGVESGRYITGYMSDVRFTKGIARYTANFTAPASAALTY